MLNLMLMRHGKSDWDAGAPDDHSRPLSNRGIRSAERMGQVLRDLDLVPDIVVSSTATRARSTAEIARISGGWSSRLILADELYGASVNTTLECAERHAGDTARVMLVGHQPTWSMTVQQLTGGTADIRTATVADIAIHAASWEGLVFARGTMSSLLQPRAFMAND
jgi:phosphohistidine phosphatase